MPHGMDIFGDDLYVLNHANYQGGERIEVLQIQVDEQNKPAFLTYKHSISGEALNKIGFYTLNSISVLKENVLYATQFTPTGALKEGVEPDVSVGFAKKCSVFLIQYNPADFSLNVSIAADNFGLANGIAQVQ